MDYQLAGTILLSGLGIVFLSLILLTLFVGCMGKAMHALETRHKKGAAEETPKSARQEPACAEPAGASGQEPDELEIVAAISAAVAVALGEDQPFVVRSVRRAPAGSKGRPAWNMAGIEQNTRPF